MKILFLILLIIMHTPRNIQAGYTADDFWNQWSSVNPRVCLCVKITPSVFWDGASAIGFTSNTRDLTLPGHSGVTFKARPGLTPTVAEQALGGATNLEMSASYDALAIDRDDVLAGKYNFAEIEVFSVSWENTSLGELVHFRGNLGNFKDYQIYFTAEANGFISRLSNDVTVITSETCRVKEFRDSRCGHTASTVTIDGTIYNIQEDVTPDGAYASTGTFIYFEESEFTVPPTENLFKNGKMEFLTGDLAGVSREIAYNSGVVSGAVAFQLKRPFEKQIGGTETVRLTVGCNRTITDCRKFSNAVNFDGEAYVPGVEAANRITSAN